MAFWPNLNVFITAFALMASMGMFVVVIPVTIVAKLVLPAREAELWAFPAAYVLIALGLAWYGWKFGLSPRERMPQREQRFRIGHGLLAFCNIAGLAMLVFAWLLPYVAAHGGALLSRPAGSLPAMQLAALAMVPFSIAPIVGIAGLVMVWTSRQREERFADTQVAGQAAKAGETAGRTVPVVIGLLASSAIVYIGLVFASLGFQGRTERFTGVVLPVAGVCFVLWVTTTLWLLGKSRGGAAVTVAWLPVLLVLVGAPAAQLLFALIAALTHRL
jgi:hypothetical protein